MLTRRITLILITALYLAIAQGQDSIKSSTWSMNGYVKDMQTVLFYEWDGRWYLENLIHNRLNFKWHMGKGFSSGAGMRNRFSFGDLIEEYPDYYESFGDDPGVVDLSWNVAMGGSYVFNVSFDRLWVDYTRNKFQVTAGRQRINWGLNYVWNPNDIFNTYSYLDFDYEEKPGADAIRFQYYPENTGRFEVTVKAAKDWVMTAAMLYQFNRFNYDFQLLGGVMDGTDAVIGAGWSGQLFKGGFRGEMSYFQPMDDFTDTSGIFVASLGYDYTFRNSLMLRFEALYNGNPNGNMSTLLSVNQSTATAMSAKNPFLSGYTVFGGLIYPFNPLISGSFSGMWNWDNKTYILIPSITFSLSSSLDLMFLAQVFQVYDDRYPVPGAHFLFGRLKWSF
jgi:hypothetical protein